MVVHSSSLLAVLKGCGVKVKTIVNINFSAFRNESDDSDNLTVLVSKAHGVGITTVVEEWHCRKDCPTYWNDVELGNVIVLQNTLSHFQTIGSSYLKMPQKQARYEYLCPLAFWSWTAWVPKESIEFETFGHEYSFSSFLEQIFKCSLVCVCSQVVHWAIGGWVKQPWIYLVTGWQWGLGMTDQTLESSFGDKPASLVT